MAYGGSMSTQFQNMTINEYLTLLGSAAPAPGGGAAAALTGAQACALAEMVSRLTENKPADPSFKEKAGKYKELFMMARSIFLDLMDEDAENFKALMALLQSPEKGAPEERKSALEEAFKKSAEAPMQMAQTMSDLLPAMTELLLHANKNVITDAIMAAEAGISCIRGAKLNVQINVKYMHDEFYKHEAEESFAAWENAISAIEAVLTYQVHL